MSRRRLTTETFKQKARLVWGDTYGHDNVDYQGYFIKVYITCRIHGDFLQTPSDHLSGYGCRACWIDRKGAQRRLTQDQAIERFRSVWGSEYIYTKVVYSKSNEKVEIICRIHGSFWQTPNSHLNGKGCQDCGKIKSRSGSLENRDKDTPALLYFLRLDLTGESFVKIGITVRTVEDRFRGLPYEIRDIRTVSMTLGEAMSLETQIKLQWLSDRYQPKHSFGGHTECFSTDALLDIAEYLDDLFPLSSDHELIA